MVASDHLGAHLPRFHLERLLREPTTAPRSDSEHAAMLLVDLAGFTRLTEDFARRGQAGAEELSGALNRYFGRMIDIITSHGGDIVEFAGDAALALWLAPGAELMSEVTHVATGAGLRVQRELDRFEPVPGVALRSRAAIGAGRVHVLEVGGVSGRWSLLVVGEALDQLRAIDRSTKPGAMIVSDRAWELVGDRCGGVRVDPLAVEILDVAPVSSPTPLPSAPRLDASALDALERLLPRSVTEALPGQHEWGAEFRTVTTCFVSLSALRCTGPDDLGAVHEAVLAIQESVLANDGYVYQLLADEKGTTLVASFGLPPLAHGDDAARAVQSALEIHRRLGEQSLAAGIGITTGRVFSGVFGTASRKNYTLRGSAINLAARLMGAAGKEILCDPATARAAGSKIAFEALEPIAVRGRPEPVEVSTPLGPTSRRAPSWRAALVGRAEERSSLSSRIERVQKGTGGLLTIEGPAGMGKSRLLSELVEDARRANVSVLVSAAEAIERSTAYFAFRDLLADVLGSELPREAQRRQLEAALAKRPALAPRAAVLNAILPLGLPDTEVTRQMDGPSRADSIEDLMAFLLDDAARARPTAIVIDDAHWLDSTSVGLARAIARRVPHLLVVLATRPPEAGADLEKLVGVGDRIRITALSSSDVGALVARRLGAETVDEAVERFVFERAEGHPLYSEELALALRDEGRLTVESSVVRPIADGLSGAAVPESLEGVIHGRIDRLTARQQLALKTASVVGPTFQLDVLRGVFPVESERDELPEVLKGLEQADVIRHQGTGAYAFKHATTHQVAYESMLLSQRRALHREVAERLEREHRGNLPQWHPLLAHHWARAEVFPRAIEHLESAGALALRSFSNREAVAFIDRADTLSGQGGVEISPDRRAGWERILGEANVKLADLKEARRHLLRCLELTERSVPSSKGAMAARLLAHVGRQMAHRARPPRPAGGADAHGDEVAAATYHFLAEVAFFSHDLLGLLHSTFASLNHAERAGAIREMVFGYGSVAHVASMVGMRGVARRYRSRSLDLAERQASLPTIAFAHQIAATFGNCIGDWEQVETSCQRAEDLFGRLGDRFRWESCLAIHGYKHLAVSDLDLARDCWATALDSAHPDGAVQVLVWTRAGRVLAALDAAEPPGGEDLSALEDLITRELPPAERTLALGALAAARSRLGDRQGALDAAHSARELMARTPPSTSYTLWSVVGAADVIVSEWAEHADPDLDEPVRQLAKILATFARAMPVGAPYAAWIEGRIAARQGRGRAAHRAWRRGLRAAEQLRMPAARTLLRQRA